MPAALTLAEELTLLAYDDETGKSTADMFFEYGVGGALLAELALLEKVSLEGKKVVVVDATPTGDQLLDDALTRIVESAPRRAQRWVDLLRKGAKAAVLRRLVAAGLLYEESGRTLLVFPTTRYPTRNSGPERAVRQRLHQAIVEGRPPERRTVTLALLVDACDMGKKVFPDVSKKQLKRTLDDLTAGDWAARATKQAIEAVRAAVIASAATAGTGSN